MGTVVGLFGSCVKPCVRSIATARVMYCDCGYTDVCRSLQDYHFFLGYMPHRLGIPIQPRLRLDCRVRPTNPIARFSERQMLAIVSIVGPNCAGDRQGHGVGFVEIGGGKGWLGSVEGAIGGESWVTFTRHIHILETFLLDFCTPTGTLPPIGHACASCC